MNNTTPSEIDFSTDYVGDERRNHIRYKAELRAQLIGSDILPMQVMTTDISMAGMHFDCDQWTAQHLKPPGENASPATAKQLTVRFKVPVNDQEQKMLTLLSKVISVQRIAQDRYRVNVRFLRFGGQSQLTLEKYFSSCHAF